MTIRSFWTLTIAFGVTASGGLCAQDADKPSQPTEPTTQSLDWIVAGANDNAALDKTTWSLIASTHGNTLGVEVAAADEALRAQLGIEPETGVVVTSIAPESAARTAGLKHHDVILRLGEESASSPELFHELVGSRQGQEVVFQVLRQGKPTEVTVTLPKVPVYDLARVSLRAMVDSHYRIGVTLAEADDTLRSQLNLAAGEGLVVTDVVADGPAAKAGLERHDVLVKLDNQRLTTVEKVNALIQEIKDRQVTVVFLRGGDENSREIAPRLANDPSRLFFGNGLKNYNYYVDPNLGLRTWMVQPNTLTVQPNILTTLDQGRATPLLKLYGYWAPNSITDQPTTTADQIARLKQQLSELQSTVQALESALQAAPAEQQPEAPPQDEPQDK